LEIIYCFTGNDPTNLFYCFEIRILKKVKTQVKTKKGKNSGKNSLRKLGNPTFKKTSLGRRLFRHFCQFQIETTNKLTLNE
jgi:hypothetical protein